VYLLFHDVYADDPRESGFCSPAADRYKLTVRQFERELSALAEARPRSLPFTLTFDDGGQSFYSIVADRIEALGMRAHCFVTTDYIDHAGFLTRAQIRELHQRGHGIGSHSASHPSRMHACPPGVILDEWRTSIARLEDITGARIDTASVPGGFYNRTVGEAAATAGVTTLFTSEPVLSTTRLGTCRIEGRFTIRQHSAPGLSARLVGERPWSRWAMWADWNAKAVIKPILGPLYIRVADWLMAESAAEPVTPKDPTSGGRPCSFHRP
jgi:hypothetical protein